MFSCTTCSRKCRTQDTFDKHVKQCLKNQEKQKKEALYYEKELSRHRLIEQQRRERNQIANQKQKEMIQQQRQIIISNLTGDDGALSIEALVDCLISQNRKIRILREEIEETYQRKDYYGGSPGYCGWAGPEDTADEDYEFK